jgi:hypothetical protein
MGEITIKIPQRIKRTFDINNRAFVDRMIVELEERVVAQRTAKPAKEREFVELSAFMKKYRSEPDAETTLAIETAKEWRKRWDR